MVSQSYSLGLETRASTTDFVFRNVASSVAFFMSFVKAFHAA